MVTKNVRFAFLKDGIFYFSRRVPHDLKHNYSTDRIAFSLRTASARVAEPRALAHAFKLDEFWLQLRMQSAVVPGHHRLIPDEEKGRPFSPLLSEARDIYVKAKGRGKVATFNRAAERTVEYLSASKGNKPLLAYTKSDVNSFRDELFARGLAGSSVVRVLSTLRAIFGFVLAETGLEAPNPFAGVYLDRNVGVVDRKAFSVGELRKAQSICREVDDDLRWLVALISDTGMRLAEAAGLAISDIILDSDYPHVRIQPHPWRSLKTTSSTRLVPLVGSALWAAQRVVQSKPADFAFPRYTKKDRTNANSASAALNKWLSEKVSKECVVHSFRHSFRDRLRAVECPFDVVDQLGGWATAGVGAGYGDGYQLEVLSRWMNAIAH